MKWFKQCNTIEEVKHLYKQLAKTHHPDIGGDTLIMQEINAEYMFAIAFITKHGTKQDFHTKEERPYTQPEQESEILQAEAYQEAINKVIHLTDIKIELIGAWLWITGNTFIHKNTLKSEPAKFTWAKKRDDLSAWFFRTEQYKSKSSKQTLEAIRNKYGTQDIKNNTQKLKDE
jgi:hypothetical protein